MPQKKAIPLQPESKNGYETLGVPGKQNVGFPVIAKTHARLFHVRSYFLRMKVTNSEDSSFATITYREICRNFGYRNPELFR